MARILLFTVLLFLSVVYDGAGGKQGRGVAAEERSLQRNADNSQFFTSNQDGLLINKTDWEIFPHPDFEKNFFNISRRTLGSFQVCGLCTCCGGRRRFCIPSACCYTITCGSPNRPFGFCSFIPMSCNCLSCRL